MFFFSVLLVLASGIQNTYISKCPAKFRKLKSGNGFIYTYESQKLLQLGLVQLYGRRVNDDS